MKAALKDGDTKPMCNGLKITYHTASMRCREVGVVIIIMGLAGCGPHHQIQLSAPQVPPLENPVIQEQPRIAEESEVVTEAPQDASEEIVVEPEPQQPRVTFTRYSVDTAMSAITVHVAQRLREIRARHPERQEQVFMKIVSSETVDRRFLRCFGGGESSPFVVDLGERSHLEETLEFFRQGDTGRGRNAFVRFSESAKVGRTAAWAYSGRNSPIRREIRAINPAWAIIVFGTNDLNHGSSPESALWPYYQHLSTLVDRVSENGIVPIILGPAARNDSKVAMRWNPAYEAVTRAVAEKRQLPYINLLHETIDLPDLGLIDDGVHGNVYEDRRRGRQACIFTEDALQYHYNIRNALTLEALDRARRALSAGDQELEEPPLPEVVGEGSVENPFLIDGLPFIHASDTSQSTLDRFDRYPSCDEDLDMSGPEVVYRLELDQQQPLKILVFTPPEVDVDLQLLGEELSPEACRARHGRILKGSLDAGIHHVIVDTFSERGHGPRPGDYQLVILRCSDNDPECSRPIE